jgi:hypothetical protein
MESLHASIGCTACHLGTDGLYINDSIPTDSLVMATSHEGMLSDPSIAAEESCGRCHSTIVENSETSLHSTFNGYKTLFEARHGVPMEGHLEEEFQGECGNCHTTCGQCHVSYPKSVKGGLVQGHRFLPTPRQSAHCTSCHGSRVGEEYTGSREGYSADVHYLPNGMNCVSCHSGREMHGNGTVYESRYHSEDMPRCEDCHTFRTGENAWHDQHADNFQCQVCHSQDYKNCNDCHVAGGGITGSSYLTFKIGKNPLPELRDYEYVVLRHIPIAEDTFGPWGVGDLNDYEALPTWKYSSPHNIQRFTSRTDTTGSVGCSSLCHNTPDDKTGFFLRQSDLDEMLNPREQAANQEYIVPDGNPTGWPEE